MVKRAQRRGVIVKAVLCMACAVAAAGVASCRVGVPFQVDDVPTAAAGREFHFGKFNPPPKPRMGGLPYPGAFTGFELADPRRLGNHAYDEQRGEAEQIRGILYTCRGGFIDLAHARKTIDLCKFAAVRAEAALMNDLPAFQLKSLEPSVFVVRLSYPPGWQSLPLGEKRAIARELSIRMGQRIAMVMITWHEVLTWFGYNSTPVVSEFPSAFTYDDSGAHAFGMLVGGRALRHPWHEWDRAVTETINSTLRELEVVTPAQASMAVERIRGSWWRESEPLKRQVEMGWTGPMVAWTVPNLPFCRNPAPYRYELPRLDNVLGRDFTGMMRIEIEPNVLESEAIRRATPGGPEVIDVDRHMPTLLNRMRRWQALRSGEQSVRP